MAFHGPGPGRPKGSKNKATLDVEAHLERLGCSPIEFLASVMMSDDDSWSAEHRLRAAIELAQYVAPKRKAIEHSGDVTTHQFVIMGAEPDATSAEWEKRNNPDGVAH